jgi:hypothetical protein
LRSELLAIERGARQVPLEGEVLPDWAKARKESPRAFGQAEPPDAPFAFARRLMAIFGAVVHARAGPDEYMLHVRQLRKLCFCRWVAA